MYIFLLNIYFWKKQLYNAIDHYFQRKKTVMQCHEPSLFSLIYISNTNWMKSSTVLIQLKASKLIYSNS